MTGVVHERPACAGRARGAMLTRVNGSSGSHSARPGEPEVSPPQL